MPSRPQRPQVGLHVVTGKGGTGKSTTAAALALALAKGGRRVLAVEVEGRDALARLLDVAPGEGERPALTTEAGGTVHVLDVDARTALHDYLRLKVRVPGAARVLTAVGAVDFATAVAPGVRDVLVLGAIHEAAGRERAGRDGPHYDVVVLDAPPTGRVARFLGAPGQTTVMVRSGPVRRQAERVLSWLRGPGTQVHLVALLEELPVQESLESGAELAAAGWPLGSVLVSRWQDPVLDDGGRAAARSDAAVGELADDLSRAGLDLGAGAVSALHRELLERVERDEDRVALRARLDDLGREVIPLRHLGEEVERDDLDRLADDLEVLT